MYNSVGHSVIKKGVMPFDPRGVLLSCIEGMILWHLEKQRNARRPEFYHNIGETVLHEVCYLCICLITTGRTEIGLKLFGSQCDPLL